MAPGRSSDSTESTDAPMSEDELLRHLDEAGVPLSEAPGHGVREARALVEAASRVLTAAVIAERSAGSSWEDIGAALGGVTKSTAHGRFAALVDEFNEAAGGEPSGDSSGRRAAAAQNLEESWDDVAELFGRRVWRGDLRRAAEAVGNPAGELPTAGKLDSAHHISAPDTGRLKDRLAAFQTHAMLNPFPDWRAIYDAGSSCIVLVDACTAGNPDSEADADRAAEDADAGLRVVPCSLGERIVWQAKPSLAAWPTLDKAFRKHRMRPRLAGDLKMDGRFVMDFLTATAALRDSENHTPEARPQQSLEERLAAVEIRLAALEGGDHRSRA